MLKRLRHNKGQVLASEYVMIFFLVVGMIFAMSMYMRRGLQARIYDARNLMAKHVNAVGHETGAVGNFYAEYEPYYAESTSQVTRKTGSIERLMAGGPKTTSGIYEVEYTPGLVNTTANVFSTTKPPDAAD